MTDLLRVALVTPTFPPQVGGVGEHVSQLARHLALMECRIDVLAQVDASSKAPAYESEGSQLSIRRFPDKTRTERFQVAPELRRFLLTHTADYDVIHAHSFHSWPALTAARLPRRSSFVFTPHYHGQGHTPLARLAHVVYDPLATTIFKRASAVLCVSASEAAHVARDYPACRDAIRVIPNGIDMSSFGNVDPFVEPGRVILVVSRLERYKQVDRIIGSMQHMALDVRLVIVGDGPVRRELERSASQLAVADRVTFLGRLSTGDVRRWQRTADIVVSMSTKEAYGLTLVEGVAAGARVVASDIPAHAELAESHPEAIDLIPAGADPSVLSRALDSALQKPAHVSGTDGLPGWSVVAEQVRDTYQDVLVHQ